MITRNIANRTQPSRAVVSDKFAPHSSQNSSVPRTQEKALMIPSNELLLSVLERIEAKLDLLARQQEVKEHYSTSELAQIMNRAEFTVRQWCRLGRIKAEKRACGRGLTKEWMVSHQELMRLQSEGLLPERRW